MIAAITFHTLTKLMNRQMFVSCPRTVFPVYIDHFIWQNYEMMKNRRQFEVVNGNNKLYDIILYIVTGDYLFNNRTPEKFFMNKKS